MPSRTGLAGETNSRPVDHLHLCVEPGFFELEAVRPKGVGCDEIASDCQVSAVEISNDLWSREIPDCGGFAALETSHL